MNMHAHTQNGSSIESMRKANLVEVRPQSLVDKDLADVEARILALQTRVEQMAERLTPVTTGYMDNAIKADSVKEAIHPGSPVNIRLRQFATNIEEANEKLDRILRSLAI